MNFGGGSLKPLIIILPTDIDSHLVVTHGYKWGDPTIQIVKNTS
jgi:hypothetical protein